MGINVNYFAVDAQQFEQFVAQTVWDGLHFIARHGNFKECGGFYAYAELPPYSLRDETYMTTAKREVVSTGRRPLQSDCDPVLQRRLCDYFNSPVGRFSSHRFLHALAVCESIPFVTDLCLTNRRWWIGGFLRWAETAPQVSQTQYARLCAIFRTILAMWAEGICPAGDQIVSPAKSFPFIAYSDNDANGARAVIDTDDIRFLTGLMRESVPANEAVFRDAPDAAEPDHERVEREVRCSIAGLLQIDKLNYENPVLITFVG